VGDDLDGLLPVGLVDPHGQRGRDPDPLEEDHDVLDGLLLLPGLLDHGRPGGAEAGHAAQPPRVLLEHPQGVDAELVDDALGHLGADAPDQPGAQVAADALDGGGQHRPVAAHLELTPVQRMVPPAALHM
jgi:hypothetical protein